MEPQTPPRRHQLTRDQIIQIKTLRSVDLKYEEIARRLSVTIRQVQVACTRESVTPQKRSGRPCQLTAAQREEHLQYVASSADARHESVASLAKRFEDWNVGPYVIHQALRKVGVHGSACARASRTSQAQDSTS